MENQTLAQMESNCKSRARSSDCIPRSTRAFQWPVMGCSSKFACNTGPSAPISSPLELYLEAWRKTVYSLKHPGCNYLTLQSPAENGNRWQSVKGTST